MDDELTHSASLEPAKVAKLVNSKPGIQLEGMEEKRRENGSESKQKYAYDDVICGKRSTVLFIQ